jgi:hypothetical protein
MIARQPATWSIESKTYRGPALGFSVLLNYLVRKLFDENTTSIYYSEQAPYRVYNKLIVTNQL